MTRHQTVIVAVILILIGTQMLLEQYGGPSFLNLSWPVIVIIIGGAMIAAFYISKPENAYLLNGCTIVWIGIFFQLMESYLKHAFSYGQMWPGLIIAVGLGQITASLLKRGLLRYLGSGIFLTAGGAVLLYFTFREWHRMGYPTMITILAASMILLGIKLVLDFFFEGKEKA